MVAKNGQTPGDVVVRCRGVRAKAYLFQHAHDPAFPDGSPAPVVLPSPARLPDAKPLYRARR